MSLETAAAAYLRVLRNAGHAFGGRAGQHARDEVLLRPAHIGKSVVSRSRDAANEAYQIDLIGIPQLMSDEWAMAVQIGGYVRSSRGTAPPAGRGRPREPEPAAADPVRSRPWKPRVSHTAPQGAGRRQ